MKKSLPIYLGLVFAMQATLAQAVPSYFFNDPVTDRTAFQAAAGSLTLESFETSWGSSTNISFPIGGPQAFTVTTPGGPLSRSSFSRGVTDGGFSMYVDEVDTSVIFTFDTAINAFGLDVNDLNYATMSFADDIGNANNNVLLNDNCSSAGGPSCENIQFFGVVNSQAFSSVTLSFDNVTGDSGSIFLDRLEYSSVNVPEPTTLALMGLGILGIGFARRRKLN